MLSTLSRIFQPGPPSDPERPRLPDTDTEADSDAGVRGNGLRLTIGTQRSDSAPLLARYHSSNLSLHTSMDSPRAGPSHVSWKTPQTPQADSQRPDGQEDLAPVRTQPIWGPQGRAQAESMSRSASSPSLLLSPVTTASASQTYRPSSVGKRSSLSVGFTADSTTVSDSDGESVRSTRSENVPKQLSPIHEQRSPLQRNPPTDSAPRTPDSTRTFDRIGGYSPSPSHSVFLNRPLKRSTSQTSTSTFRSNISTAAPAIPPLDLRPNFQNALGVPHGPNSPALAPAPRKSRFASPALPTVVGSPVQTNKVSVIYEDGASARTSSFMTAPSIHSPVAETAPPVFVARDYAASTGTNGTETEETDATQRPRPLPEGLYDHTDDTELGLRPNSRMSLHPSTQSGSVASLHGSAATRSPYSRSATPASRSESSVSRRWRKIKAFGSGGVVLSPPGQHPGKMKASHACILFWVGFVAPWCWLIGGWLLTTRGEIASDGLYAETGPVLPLWRRQGRGKLSKGKSRAEADVGTDLPVPEKVKAINGAAERRIKAKSWYPLIAPSLESLAPSTTGCGTSARKLKCLPRSRAVDPWIHRCRIAAAASGVLIFAAFVIAIVLVAGVRM